jgi:hypothetical protein
MYEPSRTEVYKALIAERFEVGPILGRRIVIGFVDGDPNALSTFGEPGDIVFQEGTTTIWQRQASGLWVPIVTGGSNPFAVDLFYLDAADFGMLPSATGVVNSAALNTAIATASALGFRSRVYIPPGEYDMAATIQHPANVIVFGVGPNTILNFETGVSAWNFATGFLRSELGYLQIHGVFGAAAPIGIDLEQSQRVWLHDMQVWDFQIGVRISSGLSFSAYNTIGPNVEINRSTSIGVQALENANANRIVSSRIFFTYNGTDTGIGVDVSSAEVLELDDVQIEAADTCIRVRNTNGILHINVHDCYLEPGTNPGTTTVGSLFDVDVSNLFDGIETVIFRNNAYSGLRGDAILPPEGLVDFDGFSRAFFGGRYGGQAAPKRNWIYNGEVLYYGLPSVLPGWGTAGVAPTLSSNPLHVTGVRSLQADANAVTSTVSVGFTVSDDGVQWVTCGCRVQVLAGNVGFFFSGVVGANARQYVPPTSIAGDGLWHEFYVTVPVDPANKSGAVSFTVDAVNGTGSILIDEAWAVPGKYSVPSTQMAHRLQFLPAPIPIVVRTGVVANEAYGPIDILTLPSTLAAPLDAMSTAPTGTIGCILRLQLTCTGAPAGLMANHHWVYVDVPASGAVIPASFDFAAWAVYSNQPVTGECTIFDTTISGGYNAGDGFSSDYTVYLVAWVLQ